MEEEKKEVDIIKNITKSKLKLKPKRKYKKKVKKLGLEPPPTYEQSTQTEVIHPPISSMLREDFDFRMKYLTKRIFHCKDPNKIKSYQDNMRKLNKKILL